LGKAVYYGGWPRKYVQLHDNFGAMQPEVAQHHRFRQIIGGSAVGLGKLVNLIAPENRFPLFRRML
jgi:hypothetical protein